MGRPAIGDIAASQWVDKSTKSCRGVVDELWSWLDRPLFMVRLETAHTLWSNVNCTLRPRCRGEVHVSYIHMFPEASPPLRSQQYL